MFNTEEQLQYWLADRLRAVGYSPEVEIVTDARHKTRADIVCRDTVIECKKILDRDKMHQAASQATLYAQHLGKSKKVIVGMPPFNSTSQKSAESAAVALMSSDPHLSVYWVNQSGVIPVGQHRASVLEAIETSIVQPVAVPAVSTPVTPRPSTPTALQRPAKRPIPLWKLATAVAYVIMGVWLGGGIGALIGAISGVMFVQWN